MGLQEIWEDFVDDLGYFFRFEWISDAGDFFSGMFDNLSEFSTTGLVFAFLFAGVIFLLRKQMLHPFLQNMNPVQSVIWGALTYIMSAVAGYLIGKAMSE